MIRVEELTRGDYTGHYMEFTTDVTEFVTTGTNTPLTVDGVEIKDHPDLQIPAGEKWFVDATCYATGRANSGFTEGYTMQHLVSVFKANQEAGNSSRYLVEGWYLTSYVDFNLKAETNGFAIEAQETGTITDGRVMAHVKIMKMPYTAAS